ncbi:hypothetical protein GGR51DRAFT_569360 [Nemania sp. FL0031]|nr:hypothetical protein GGR51DRAFT_569360 [Nemania sp. FL0031]
MIDSDFSAVNARYCPVYLPSLPLDIETSLSALREAFLEIDGVIGREHTQLMPAYESFLKRGVEVASELRRPALLREYIDSIAWVLRDPTFQLWQKPNSSPMLFISGPPGSGKRIVSWSIPYLLEAQNQKRRDDQKELYLVFDFGYCNASLDKEQNFLMSLIYQCLTLRPQLFRYAKVLCETILDLRPGSISCGQLWALLCRLLSASKDQRVFLIVIALDEFQGERIDKSCIFNGLIKLVTNDAISRKLKILLTSRAIVNTTPPEALHIDLAESEEQRAGIQTAQAHTLLDNHSRMSGLRGYLDEVTKDPFSPSSDFFDIMLRVVLLETTKTQSKASLTQALNSMKSINSTGDLYRLLFKNIGDLSMVKEALNWVFHATRPLTASELSVAIALSSSHTLELSAGEDIMESLEDNISWDIRRDLQGIIGKVKRLAGSMSNVYFIHDSFRQYFVNCEDLYIPDFHSLITERCLSYILGITKPECGYLDAVKNPPRSLAFLNYADQNWTEHYKLSTHPNSSLNQKVITFLLGGWGPAWFERLQTNGNAVLGAVEGNPLVMLVERGLANAVDSMQTALHPPLLKGWNSEMALQAAIWRDDLAIFERILPTMLPFLEPTFLQRCLQLASEYGRTGHANIILSNLDASYIDTLVKSENSPCLIAAKSGHMQTLTALLQKLPDEAILQRDSSSRTVLHWAAQWGDAGALRDLYSRKDLSALILSVDGENSTALHLAAASGSVKAVEFLLERSDELAD